MTHSTKKPDLSIKNNDERPIINYESNKKNNISKKPDLSIKNNDERPIINTSI
jgi:hypothetical protein